MSTKNFVKLDFIFDRIFYRTANYGFYAFKYNIRKQYQRVNKKEYIEKILAMIFPQYGKILQIVTLKGLNLHRQSSIVFQDTSSATHYEISSA